MTYTYGLWDPTHDGQRNGRDAGQLLMTASLAEVRAFPPKIEAGKAEALQMLESRNVCERPIGAYHHAYYEELESWVAKAAARLSAIAKVTE
ncbi:hypothetical protein ACVWZV_005640 [Bradyrhizobium sp. GM5.1]